MKLSMIGNPRRWGTVATGLCAAALLLLASGVWAQDAAVPGRKTDLDDVSKSYEAFSKHKNSLEALQSELEALAARRRAMQSERAYLEAKMTWARQKLAGRSDVGGDDKTQQEDREKWMKELKTWEDRYAGHQESLAKIVSEEDALMKALGEVARSRNESDMLIPGETLEVYVAEDDTLNGIYQVRSGGYIVLPRLPKIFVAGKTIRDVEKTIAEALQESQLRDATVTVDRVQAQVAPPTLSGDVIYLTGEVKRGGPWAVPEEYSPTVVTALLRNELTSFADLTRVKVLRLVDGRGLIETVNVDAIMNGQGLTEDFTLQPNDIVIVPAKETGEDDRDKHSRRYEHRIYVMGNVVKPGIVTASPPARITALAAIWHSNGPSRNADLTNLELVRIERHETVRRTINLKDIMDGQAPDVDLRAEDILILYGKDERRTLQPVRVYLSGNVKKAGPVEIQGLDGELTLLQALMHNGGFARFADQADVYVLRDMGNGIRNRIPVNVKKVKKGIIPDIILKDNDMIVVPEKFFSF